MLGSCCDQRVAAEHLKGRQGAKENRKRLQGSFSAYMKQSWEVRYR